MTLRNNTTRELLQQSDITVFDVTPQNVTGNVTVTPSKMVFSSDIHLWLPYVVLTLVLVAMAVASFVKYHYKNKIKYREKLEAAKMKANKPFRKYRVKLGGRGLGESESKCDGLPPGANGLGLPLANGINVCRSTSRGSDYLKWMDLDVKSFAQSHNHDLMVKQSPAHSQGLAYSSQSPPGLTYSYNNPAFETSGASDCEVATSDCDIVPSDFDVTPDYNDATDSSDIKMTEFSSSSSTRGIKSPDRIDQFLRSLGMYSESEYDEEGTLTSMRKPPLYPIDSSTGYCTSMMTSGDSFNLDTDTGTECGTISTVNPSNPSNRDSFVSFDSDQTYDARSQEARMAGYDSLRNLDDGVARVFVNDYDNYHTDTDNIDTDNNPTDIVKANHIDNAKTNLKNDRLTADIDSHHITNSLDMPDLADNPDSDTLTNSNSEKSIIEKDTEFDTESMSLPRSTTSPESPGAAESAFFREGAVYDLPPSVRYRNQAEVEDDDDDDSDHVTAL